MNKNVCLMGNPNCGKTTLFNSLTGNYEPVGNWTGVTTQAKKGKYKKDKSITVVDLPGVYTLQPSSSDERAVSDFLKNTPPSVIINLVDGTNLERNLYLTCELTELKIPTVIAVNYCDDLDKNGIKLNVEKLSQVFGVPVVSVSALKKINLEKLVGVATTTESIPKTISKGEDKTESYYRFIESNICAIITKKQTKAENFTLKADKILTHKYIGIPIFFAVISLIYLLSMRIGGYFGGFIEEFFLDFGENTAYSLFSVGAKGWLVSLVKDGIFKGFGVVFSFLPQIIILFILLTLLEESGYMSRVAYIFDGFFEKIGLGGKSVIPLVLSCGCSVTGVMATRTIDDENEKFATVILAPFMPCGAKAVLFGWFSHAFFADSVLIATSAYFLSLFAVAFFGKILKRFKRFKSGGGSFLLEMPTLRRPPLSDLIKVVWEKIKDFSVKAGTVIFSVSVCVWTLQNFGVKGYTDGKVENSFLFLLGNCLKFVFYPLGFKGWETSVSLVSGILAKEAVVETLEIVANDYGKLFLNPFSVYAYMAFVLLMPPCFATLSVTKKELKNRKDFLFCIAFQFASAYVTAFVINILGILFFSSVGLILSVVIAIIITVIFAFCIKRSLRCCYNCKTEGGCKKCRNARNTTL